MDSKRHRMITAVAVALVVAGGCAPTPSPALTAPGSAAAAHAVPASGPSGQLQPPRSTLEPEAGARVRVVLDGTSGCSGATYCTARLSVLADASPAPVPSWEPAVGDPSWQGFGGAALGAPPDGDLPTLAVGGHLVGWSISIQHIATDPPVDPPTLAARCVVRVVVAPTTTQVTIRVRFGGGPSGDGPTSCSLRAIASDAQPAATAAPISGAAILPAARMPTAWRQITPGPDLANAAQLGWRIALGTAPDGAFIAIASSEGEALVLRSVDGEHWSPVGPLPNSKGAAIMTMASNGRAIVAAGWGGDAKHAAIWASPDGVAWTRLLAARADGLSTTSQVAANSSGFAAIGDGIGAAPWISTDPAVAWSHVGSRAGSDDAGMSALAASGDGFVGVGWARGTPPSGPQPSNAVYVDARAWRSADGRTWLPVLIPGGEGHPLRNVAAQGQRVIAFSDPAWPEQGTVIYLSEDGGQHWARTSGPVPDSAGCQVLPLRDGWLATTYTVWSSTDGTAWSDAAWTAAAGPVDASTRVAAVAANDSRVVAITASDGAPPRFFVGTNP